MTEAVILDKSAPSSRTRMALWLLIVCVAFTNGFPLTSIVWRLGYEPSTRLDSVLPLMRAVLLLAIVSCSPCAFGMRLGNHRKVWWFYVAWLVLEVGYVFLIRQMSPVTGFPRYRDPGVYLVSPFSQELLFRGFIYGVLADMYPSSEASRKIISKPVFFSALLFSLVHIWWITRPACDLTLLRVVGVTFIAGLAYGYMRRRSGSILGPFVLHVAWNFIATL